MRGAAGAHAQVLPRGLATEGRRSAILACCWSGSSRVSCTDAELPLQHRHEAGQHPDRAAARARSSSSCGSRCAGRPSTTSARSRASRRSRRTTKQRKVLVWPDLVYHRADLHGPLSRRPRCSGPWCVRAPLEEPASSARTPNPSKAPWYFLGLQEMLVYFDPWIAGVLLPDADRRRPDGDPVHRHATRKGNGYYTLDERQVRDHRRSSSGSSSSGSC